MERSIGRQGPMITPSMTRLIRYIHEAWNSITQDKSQAPPVFYKSVPEPRLAGFTPFDLKAGGTGGLSTTSQPRPPVSCCCGVLGTNTNTHTHTLTQNQDAY
ncbi:hypothetical protein quinque_000070 [Culex quinquefasciatus]